MIGMHVKVDSLGRRLVQTNVSSVDDQKVLLEIEIKEYLDLYGALTPSWHDARDFIEIILAFGFKKGITKKIIDLN
jgi:hypothetical protein